MNSAGNTIGEFVPGCSTFTVPAPLEIRQPSGAWRHAFASIEAAALDRIHAIQLCRTSQRHGSSDSQGFTEATSSALQAACVEVYRSDVSQLLNLGRETFLADSDGIWLGRFLSRLYDRWLAFVGMVCVIHLKLDESNALCPEIVAAGGYGRGLMSPNSDVDLLILVEQSDEVSKKFAELMLYILWDCGLKLGHAVRSVAQCLTDAEDNHTVRTSLLETRHIFGFQQRHTALTAQISEALTRWNPQLFVANKLHERDKRVSHVSLGRYLREPNVKDGKGGQRDLQLIRWLALGSTEQLSGVRGWVETGVLGVRDYQRYQRCDRFMRTIRSHLHYLASTPPDLLTFEHQYEIARRLHYSKRGNQLPVERMMRQYYFTVREVGELVRAVCTELERRDIKQLPATRQIQSQNLSPKHAIEPARGVELRENRPSLSNPETIGQDPLAIMRLFEIAANLGADIHPSSRRLLLNHSPKWEAILRGMSSTYEIFLDLLTRQHGSATPLRQMHETGVLGAIVPAFRRIEALAPFNRYHYYTVDEHLLRTVENIGSLERGDLIEDEFISEELRDLPMRRALYVAALLHDVGKDSPGKHEVTGAEIVQNEGMRLTLTEQETELAAWLIRNHLIFSETAQRRDIHDPKTIRDFAELVTTTQRLKLLLALTLADVHAVGPEILTHWKIGLFRDLYICCDKYLSSPSRHQPANPNVEAIKLAVRDTLPVSMRDEFTLFERSQYSHFWHLDTPDRLGRKCMAWLKHRLKESTSAENNFTESISTYASEKQEKSTGFTELIVIAPDSPKFAMALAHACALNNASILSATLYTTCDGDGLYTAIWAQQFADAESEMRLAANIARDTQLALNKDPDATNLAELPKAKSNTVKIDLFKINTVVSVPDEVSANATVIEIETVDVPGLLYALTRVFWQSGLSIRSARISSYGERAIDSFYLCDEFGNKLNNQRTAGLKTTLEQSLEMFIDTHRTAGSK